ncbi:MAG: alpha/beta fold hydrolase, partial [Polaribacter sp.]|nr:alpha/beta fold hydrolase [Polaribacter sp.]
MSNNQIVHSIIQGEGFPLLILHGYFGSSDNWKTLANQFAEDFQVHAIDQRNHGRSFHEDEFNYEVLVADLYNYIQHHQLEKVYLIGHSMGGKTAMLFAVTYPDLVEKLIIVDISPKEYQPHHNAILAGLNSIDFSIQTSRNLVDEQLSKFIPEFGVRQFLMKNVYWKEKGVLDYRFNLQS